MTRFTFSIVIVFCATLTVTSSASAAARPMKATVCELSNDPSRFDGKVVTFSGQYESDGLERSILTDSSCSGTGIAVLTPKHYVGEAVLAKALDVGMPGTIDKIIKGTFVGRFRWQPHSNPSLTLVLIEARDISSATK